MRRKHLLLACCLCLCLPASARRYPYQNRKLSVDERVADLLQRMTLDEKIAETNLLPYYESTDSVIRAKIRAGKVGALLKANGAERNRSLQREAIRHSRLGIPLVFHEDVIHGYRTLGPIPLAESCSWDTAMVRRSAMLAAREVVQLYLRDEVATVIPREKELRGFASVLLQPGEERDVCFVLPSEAFRIYNNRMERVLEPGRFQLLTGTNSEEVQACEISFE